MEDLLGSQHNSLELKQEIEIRLKLVRDLIRENNLSKEQIIDLFRFGNDLKRSLLLIKLSIK